MGAGTFPADLALPCHALRELLESTRSPVVFCHNDVQEGEWMSRKVSVGRWRALTSLTCRWPCLPLGSQAPAPPTAGLV